jgi:hypothetical protein
VVAFAQEEAENAQAECDRIENLLAEYPARIRTEERIKLEMKLEYWTGYIVAMGNVKRKFQVRD